MCRGMFVEVAGLSRVYLCQSATVFTVSNEVCIIQNFSLLRGMPVNMCAFVTKHMFIGQ